MRRHPSQQSEFPVRISIFWLLHRESFTRTLETTETRQSCISDLRERYKAQTVDFNSGTNLGPILVFCLHYRISRRNFGKMPRNTDSLLHNSKTLESKSLIVALITWETFGFTQWKIHRFTISGTGVSTVLPNRKKAKYENREN